MLTRRSSLLLPWLVAACGGGEARDFPPLHYNYLTPLRLNVATIRDRAAIRAVRCTARR